MMDYVKRVGEFFVLKINELYICMYGHFKLQECEKSHFFLLLYAEQSMSQDSKWFQLVDAWQGRACSTYLAPGSS
jgi:hypothetical protein